MGGHPDWSGSQDPAAAGNDHTEADVNANTSGSQTHNDCPGCDTNSHNACGHGRKASGDDGSEAGDNDSEYS